MCRYNTLEFKGSFNLRCNKTAISSDFLLASASVLKPFLLMLFGTLVIGCRFETVTSHVWDIGSNLTPIKTSSGICQKKFLEFTSEVAVTSPQFIEPNFSVAGKVQQTLRADAQIIRRLVCGHPFLVDSIFKDLFTKPARQGAISFVISHFAPPNSKTLLYLLYRGDLNLSAERYFEVPQGSVQKLQKTSFRAPNGGINIKNNAGSVRY